MNPPELTPDRVRAATKAYLELIQAIATAIRDSGPLGVPSGTLYASVMSVVPLDAYNRIVTQLVSTGLVRLDCHCLYWVQPKEATE
jgi:hypothetical protein